MGVTCTFCEQAGLALGRDTLRYAESISKAAVIGKIHKPEEEEQNPMSALREHSILWRQTVQVKTHREPMKPKPVSLQERQRRN